ncbi:23339_t:CDS:1, partial [Gigaspora margarita]
MKIKANKTAKSRGIRFVNITSNVGSPRADGCFHNEYVINDEQAHTVRAPYELTLNIDEIIYPSKNPYRSTKTDEPPRPQNSFLLFRKDFEAKHRSLHKGEKISSQKISSLAAERWNKQPPSVRLFFRKLEDKALEKHKEMYPNYRYQPNKKKQDHPNNVIEENLLNFETFQSQDTPTQPSNILETYTTSVSGHNTENIVYDSNIFFQDYFNYFNYNLIDDHTFFSYNNYFFVDIFDPALSNTTLVEADNMCINNYVLDSP